MEQITRSLLIVSDDDLVPDELVAALGRSLEVRLLEGESGETTSIALDIASLRLHGSWDLSLRENSHDLCILVMQEMSAALSEAAIEALMRRVGAVLWIGDGVTCAERRYFRSLPACILTRPVAEVELRAAVLRLLVAARPWRTPDRCEILRRLLASGAEAIEPVISHADVGVVRYPVLERCAGIGSDARGVLDEFVRLGALESGAGLRLHLCSACADHRLVYEERCAACGSLDFEIETMIHHFACGTVEPASAFGDGSERRCPKCHEQLRTLGQDHQRYADRFTCGCGASAPQPQVLARCLGCGLVQEPEQTEEVVHPRYLMTDEAHHVVVEGWDDARSLGRLREPRTRLFRRQVLVFEIKREEARAREIGHCFSVIAVVIRNAEQLRSGHGSYGLEHIDRVLAGCVPCLRLQDVAVRWSLDTAVVLLPDTAEDAMAQTIDRLAESLMAIAARLPEPGAVVGLAGACSTRHDDATALVRHALEEARAGAESSSASISDSALFVVKD